MRKIIRYLSRYIRDVSNCVYLLTVGMCKRNCRALLDEVSCRIRALQTSSVSASASSIPQAVCRQIPEVSAKEVVGDATHIHLMEPDCVDGNVTGYELAIFNLLIARRQPETCFEIGTFDGRTTLNMAANASEKAIIFTLDLPRAHIQSAQLKLEKYDVQYIQKQSSGTRYHGTKWESQIHQLYGDSASFDYTPYLGKCDVVFVDGSHSYDYLKNDTQIALKLIVPHYGMIIWHDYGSPCWEGVTRALNELHDHIPELKSMVCIKGTTLAVYQSKPPIVNGAS